MTPAQLFHDAQLKKAQAYKIQQLLATIDARLTRLETKRTNASKGVYVIPGTKAITHAARYDSATKRGIAKKVVVS